MTPLEQGVQELRELVDRFTTLSESAMRACVDADDDGLTASLAARDAVSTRLDVVTAQVRALRIGAPRDTRTALDATLRPVQEAARRAQALNAVLLRRVEDWRVGLGRQVEQLRRDHAATSAYHVAGPRPAGLDETR